tara:strand:- start:896 stop:1486 length:591 start_codon:yes stop_codon:yes gene_type:complete
MGITKGINIECSDIVGAGGIRNILIRTWADGDTVTYTNTSTVHGISSIKHNAADATWFNYEFKQELPSLTVTAARENGSTSYECALSFMMPDMDAGKSAALQSLMDTCMMVIAVGNNGKSYVLGVSQKYSNEKKEIRNQTYASMTGAEGATGAGINDDNGWTVTMGCKQWEAPRLYTGALTLYTNAGSGTGTSTTT